MSVPLAINGLRITLGGDPSAAPIVDGVDLTVGAGETVGLVGESGSGKSLTCLAAMDLLPASLRSSGRVELDGEDLAGMSARRKRQVRGTTAAMIFQEPMSSLNPVLTVGVQLDEALRHGGLTDRGQRRRRAVELLDQVGITQPERRLRQHPHELSGGMCQRVMIAIALAGQPRLLIADEPTTALDVTIQAQILDLLRDLVDRLGMSLLLVTHDIGVVAEICQRVCVMYGGRIVESGPVATVLDAPRHPYTDALLRSVPTVDGPLRTLAAIPGTVPTAGDMPPGCRFHPRCPLAEQRCRQAPPPLSAGPAGTALACWVKGEH
jgi:oligopeptide/dipeptide ABC transporter ATP-binding protein